MPDEEEDKEDDAPEEFADTPDKAPEMEEEPIPVSSSLLLTEEEDAFLYRK